MTALPAMTALPSGQPVNKTIRAARIDRRPVPHCAKFLNRSLRPKILRTDDEDNVVHKLKRVIQH
jgi:hypothetical protein